MTHPRLTRVGGALALPTAAIESKGVLQALARRFHRGRLGRLAGSPAGCLLVLHDELRRASGSNASRDRF